jgi:hypothetical protein
LVGDFSEGVPVIVDLDLVEDIIAKLKEIRATRWLLQRNIVADQGDCVWSVGADKGIDISIVSHGIPGNFGCFTMG